jgi:hypothetical protein
MTYNHCSGLETQKMLLKEAILDSLLEHETAMCIKAGKHGRRTDYRDRRQD